MNVGPDLRRLLSVASPPLLNADDGIDRDIARSEVGVHRDQLRNILGVRNGFLAFEGALRFLPSRTVPICYGLGEWNSEALWRYEYGSLADGCFFFAEDIFGGQFCINDNRIWTFDPETGERALIAETLDEWARKILDDYNLLTGYSLAHQWQEAHGKLTGRNRLLPKVPFVAGGGFEVSNLVAVDAAEGMRVRGAIARQIRYLPDGTSITIESGPV